MAADHSQLSQMQRAAQQLPTTAMRHAYHLAAVAAAAEAGAPAFVVVTSVQLCLWSLTPALTMNSNTQQQQQLRLLLL
jgi:hypothetical protein